MATPKIPDRPLVGLYWNLALTSMGLLELSHSSTSLLVDILAVAVNSVF
jgi:hypothetical protein